MHCFNIIDLTFIWMFQYVFNSFYTTSQIKYLCFTIRTILNFNRSLGCIYLRFRHNTLVNIFCCVIEYAQHRHNSVTFSVSPANMAVARTHIVNVHTNSTRPFTDKRTVLERIVNPLDAIFFHRNQKT